MRGKITYAQQCDCSIRRPAVIGPLVKHDHADNGDYTLTIFCREPSPRCSICEKPWKVKSVYPEGAIKEDLP